MHARQSASSDLREFSFALGEAERRRAHRQGIDKNRCVYPVPGVDIAWVAPRIEGREPSVMAVSQHCGDVA